MSIVRALTADYCRRIGPVTLASLAGVATAWALLPGLATYLTDLRDLHICNASVLACLAAIVPLQELHGPLRARPVTTPFVAVWFAVSATVSAAVHAGIMLAMPGTTLQHVLTGAVFAASTGALSISGVCHAESQSGLPRKLLCGVLWTLAILTLIGLRASGWSAVAGLRESAGVLVGLLGVSFAVSVCVLRHALTRLRLGDDTFRDADQPRQRGPLSFPSKASAVRWLHWNGTARWVALLTGIAVTLGTMSLTVGLLHEPGGSSVRGILALVTTLAAAGGCLAGIAIGVDAVDLERGVLRRHWATLPLSDRELGRLFSITWWKLGFLSWALAVCGAGLGFAIWRADGPGNISQVTQSATALGWRIPAQLIVALAASCCLTGLAASLFWRAAPRLFAYGNLVLVGSAAVILGARFSLQPGPADAITYTVLGLHSAAALILTARWFRQAWTRRLITWPNILSGALLWSGSAAFAISTLALPVIGQVVTAAALVLMAAPIAAAPVGLVRSRHA